MNSSDDNKIIMPSDNNIKINDISNNKIDDIELGKKIVMPSDNGVKFHNVPVHDISSSDKNKSQIIINEETIDNIDNNNIDNNNIDINDNIKNNLINSNNINVQWNPKILIQLKKLGEKSMGFKWMHDQESLHYIKLNKIFTRLEVILLVCLGLITANEFITFLSNSGINNSKSGILIVSSIQLFLIFIFGIVKNLRDTGNYPNKIHSHRYDSMKFSEISTDIINQFAIPILERDNSTNFLQQKTKEYNELRFTMPPIRPITINKYIEATESHDIYKPILVGGVETIDIVIDKNDNISMNVTDPINTKKYKNNLNSDNEKNKYIIERWLNNF